MHCNLGRDRRDQACQDPRQISGAPPDHARCGFNEGFRVLYHACAWDPAQVLDMALEVREYLAGPGRDVAMFRV